MRQDLNYKNGQVHTPVLDAMHAAGVDLPDLYVYKMCAPSRASVLSGRYPWHVGYYNNNGGDSSGVSLEYEFLPSVLKRQSNYSTHALGKWHVGWLFRNYTATYRGFDTFYGYLTGSELHYTKEQRRARGTPGNASQKILYPDARTEKGPIETQCVEVPPHEDQPGASVGAQFCGGPSPPPGGLGSVEAAGAGACDALEPPRLHANAKRCFHVALHDQNSNYEHFLFELPPKRQSTFAESPSRL